MILALARPTVAIALVVMFVSEFAPQMSINDPFPVNLPDATRGAGIVASLLVMIFSPTVLEKILFSIAGAILVYGMANGLDTLTRAIGI